MVEWIIALTVLGVILIALEIFLPGGVLGFAGALCLLGGMGVAVVADEFNGHPWLRLGICLGILAVAVMSLVLGLKYFDKTPFARIITLQEEVGHGARDRKSEVAALIGQEATARGDLRPLGSVKVGEQRHEATSRTGYVESGTKVRIVAVEDLVLVVEPISNSAAAASPTLS